jgi:diguanylate cyclase (GGDEF)-like protein
MAPLKPYKIAFLANNFYSEYCHTMYSGLNSAVAELGVSLVTVAGGDIDSPLSNNIRRNRIFDLVNTDDFDGIIFQAGSLINYITEQRFFEFCSRFEGIPSVHIGLKKTGYSSIVVDNGAGMKELVDHFIEVHHRKEIAFIRGPISCTDADERFDAYRQSLKEHGINYNENLVFQGNFLQESGLAAVKEFIDNRKINFDALIAANDQMALFAMNELLHRGIRVPGDICIGGFDNLISARACSPALTTVGQPVFDLGKSALCLLIDIIEGKKTAGTGVTLPSRLILRRSCGCISVPLKSSGIRVVDIPAYDLFEKQLVNLLKDDQSSVIEFLVDQIIYFLKNGSKLDELLSSLDYILDKHAQEISPNLHNKIRQMFLTISEEQCEIRQLKRQEEYSQLYNFIDDLRKLSEPDDIRKYLHAMLSNIEIKEMIISRYKDKDNSVLFYRKSSYESGTEFRSNQFLPGGISSLCHPFNLICLPLFGTNSDIGFFLTNPTDNNPVILETIRSSLCGTLHMMEMIANERLHGVTLEKKVQERTTELQCALNKLSEANDKLEQISVRDELTGLLNRRGFLSTASRYVALAKRNLSLFVCIYFDLDKLKIINDTYGHAHGDTAIKAIASILNKTFRQTDVIGRIGGDEFTVLALDYSETGCNGIIERIDFLVDEYNNVTGNPWKLGYSCGIASSSQEHGFNIDTLMKLADQALYKHKQEKKKNEIGGNTSM